MGTDNVLVKQVFRHYEQNESPVGVFKYCPSCGTQLALREGETGPRPTCTHCGFVQYRNPAPAVSILITDGERVLLGKRLGNPGQGAWALPSGYIDFDEDFLTAALRETKEETGLEVAICSILNVVSSFVSPRFHFLGIYVMAKTIGGRLVAGDDLEEVRWFPIHTLPPEMGFLEDVQVIQMVGSGWSGLPVDPDYAGGNLGSSNTQ